MDAPTTHFYEPDQGHRLLHSPLKAIVAPRPIGWISTLDETGRVNLAPYSFFNAVCETPPIVYFSSKGRKDSLRNAQRTGEFVANLVTEELGFAMNETAAEVAPGVDEMALAGLEPAASTMVRPPRVARAAAALECRLLEVRELVDLEGRPTDWHMVLGQVVGVHIDPRHLKDGLFDTAGARVMARCGYRGFYSVVDRLVEIVRPAESSVLAP
jgi:flavin reductase (DIM6/NTAB) family NADH-FMN oxidoreductase RutF